MSICGESSFALVSENGTIPLCFLELFLYSLNSVFLVTFGAYRMREVYKKNQVDISYTKLHLAKLILFLSLAFFPVLRSVVDLLTKDVALYKVISSFITSVAALFGVFLMLAEYSRALRNNWVLRTYWTVYFILSGLEFQSNIYATLKDDADITIAFVTFVVSGVMAVIGLFFNKIHEAYEKLVSTNDENDAVSIQFDRKVNAEGQASILSKLVFAWLNPLLLLGYKRPLEASDIYDTPEIYHGTSISETFERYWDEEKAKPNPSLSRAIRRAFGRKFVIAGFFKLGQDSLMFVGPVVLQLIIAFVSTPTESNYVGFSYVILLFASSVLQSLLLHQYFFMCYNVGMQVRGAIVTAVYKKAFTLSNKSRQSSTVGEIVNLQAVDSGRMQELFPYLHTMWSAPAQMVVSLFMLWRLVGPSVLAGLGVMILTTPINGVIMKKLGKIQKDMMQSKDNRTKIMNEVLNGIRVIKFFAWEKSFLKKIMDIRDNELTTLKKTLWLRALSLFFWSGTPVLVSVVTFSIFSLTGGELTPEVAFTALALFNILRFPLNILPMMISGLVEARVSINRLTKFLTNEELDPQAVTREKDPEFAIAIKDGSFKWDEKTETPTLSHISIRVAHGKLVAVVGSVGSGKSSLLSAILGEIPKLGGSVNVTGSVAYVAQQPWIQNATLRDNITFGKPFVQKKYDEVLKVCELTPDIAILPNGDMTEIGEKGINLSGGQKQRVSLARAVYQDCDVYLFDDCLSAVDAHVGRNIFENCISGMLRQKTRMLVTHQLQFVSSADVIVVLKDGKVSESGSYDTLMDSNGDFSNMIKTHVKESKTVAKEEEKKETKSEKKEEAKSDKPKAGGKITSVEERDVGDVDMAVYKSYLGAYGGIFMFLLLLLLFASDTGGKLAADFWLSYWSSNTEKNTVAYYLGIYATLSLVACFFTYWRALGLNYGGINAAKNLHDKMLERVLRAPMSFFDTTPIGRILNRFSKDQYTIDDSLSRTLGMFMNTLFNALSVIVVIAVATPFFITGLLPLAFLYRHIQKYYLQSSRELKRIDSITRSPIYAQFSETLSGLSTIRSYQRRDDFISANNAKLDLNTCAYYVLQTANRWLGIRLEFLGTCVVTLAAAFAVIERDSIAAGLAGLSISYALQMTGILNWLVRMATEAETSMVSVERVLHYTKLETEAPAVIPDKRPPGNWPTQGAIQFKDVKMRYREGLDLVLQGISLDIKGKEKIGVVGRTGAGKSSLMLALFRLVELAEGQVTIDGVDISTLGLDDLREKLSIIPQEPTLFTGTVRSNLDPFNQHSDHDIWQVLQAVHLKAPIEALALKLDAPVTEAGENFSVGQRQLMCLGRALLRRAKILVMDEATAAIDFETDALIQKTIREQFKEVTVLTIAHRIHTIMDYDRVLVLERGRVAEYDSPANLMKNTNGIFHSMVQKSGTATEDE